MLEDAAHDLIDQTRLVSEQVRVKVLHSLRVLDTPPEIIFDDVVNVARQVCGTRSATLTFIDEHDAFIKASTGGVAWSGRVPREDSFCSAAIATPNEPMLVTDARADPRFCDYKYTLDGSVTFYYGVPMLTEQGVALGALCVVDDHPRGLGAEQKAAMKSLARIVTRLAMDSAARVRTN